MAGKNGFNSPEPEERSSGAVPVDVMRLVRSVGRRLWFTRLLAGLNDGLVIGLLIMLGYILLAKAFPFMPDDAVSLTWFSSGLILCWLSAGLVLARLGGLSDGAIAALIDERLELKDRFTTAIHCAHRNDPFARAALEEAVSSVSSPESRRKVLRSFTPRMPSGSLLVPVLAVLIMLTQFFVPSGDLLRRDGASSDPNAIVERIDNEKTVQAVLETIRENPALSDEMAALGQSLELDDALAGRSDSPEAQRREALRRISDLERQLDDLVNGEQGKTMESLNRSMDSLSSAPDGETQPLVDALKSSDFTQAMKELEKIQAKIDDPSLSDEQREKLASELEDLARQLADAAQNREALEEALQRAGMDPALAGDAKALEQAMKQASGLNQQQMQQLKQMMNAQKSSAQQCQNMSQSLGKMAQQCKNGGQGQPGMQGAQQMLSQAEQAQQMLQAAKSAMSQCQGGGKPGQGMAGILPSQAKPMPLRDGPIGQGFGNQGRGGSGNAPGGDPFLDQVPEGERRGPRRRRRHLPSARRIEAASRWRIFGRTSADRGSDRAELGGGVQDEPVPAHLRDVHKHYFGALKKRIDANRRESSGPVAPAPTEESASPAEPAGDDSKTGSSESSKSE